MTAAINSYDIIFAGIILVSIIMALIRGGVAELLSLSVWFLAFIVMHNYGGYIAKYIPHNISNQFLRSAIAFIAIFIVLAVLMAIVKTLCRGLIKGTGLLGLDSLLGVLFGLIRGIIICAIVIILTAMLRLDAANSYQQARLYPVIVPVVNWIVSAVPVTHNYVYAKH